MSKNLDILTPKLEVRCVYTQGTLEPVGEEARELYASLQRLHDAVPMASLAFDSTATLGMYRFEAVSRAGSTWRQGILLEGGPDRDPPMTFSVASRWRASESAPLHAVREAILAVRNRYGLLSLAALWPSTSVPRDPR